MSRLWSIDGSGEAWLGESEAIDNPYVMVANPARKKHRKGPRKGVMPPALKRYWATHKRRGTRGNPAVVVHARRRPRVTLMRKNPGGGGGARGFLSRFPDLPTIGGVGLGFVAPPMIVAQIAKFLPASIMASQPGYWMVKAAAALVPPFLIRKFGQVRLGTNMLIGGVVSLTLDLLKTFAPGFFSGGVGSQPMLGYYATGQIPAAALPAAGQAVLRRGGGMGMYTPNAYPQASPQARMIATVPDRLNPANRF